MADAKNVLDTPEVKGLLIGAVASNSESQKSKMFPQVGRNVFAKNCVLSVDCLSTVVEGFDEDLVRAAIRHWYQEKENYDFGRGFKNKKIFRMIKNNEHQPK